MCNRSRKFQPIETDENIKEAMKRNDDELSTQNEDILKSEAASSNTAKLWLLIWLFNNIGLTLLNKTAFATVDFKYPYYLSFVHMVCNAAGAEILISITRRAPTDSYYKRTIESVLGAMSSSSSRSNEIDRKGHLCIFGFSIIFSLNIAIGNVSLRHVSVNFNQVMRSMVPVITILLGMALGKKFTLKRICSVIPIIMGVSMACFGDMSYTFIGFQYTVLAIILAAVKVIASNEVLTGNLKLHPIELLGHMAPLAMVQCLILSFVTGETSSIASRWNTDFNPSINPYPLFIVFLSGICSFSLNICSLTANKLTSPLTMCIAANVKQVLMIAISTIIFHTDIPILNGCGIIFVLIGGALYSYICFIENNKHHQKTTTQNSIIEKKNTCCDDEKVQKVEEGTA